MNKLDKFILALLKSDKRFNITEKVKLHWIRCVEFNSDNYKKISELINTKKISELETFETLDSNAISDDIIIYKVHSSEKDFIILVKDFYELSYNPIILEIFPVHL